MSKSASKRKFLSVNRLVWGSFGYSMLTSTLMSNGAAWEVAERTSDGTSGTFEYRSGFSLSCFGPAAGFGILFAVFDVIGAILNRAKN